MTITSSGGVESDAALTRLIAEATAMLEALEVVSHDPKNEMGWIVMVDEAIRKAKG
jgi:hypothetical protein